MPKASSRRFLNLLGAFGVKGGGDDLRFPLSGSVAPVLDVDRYDPPPLYGLAQFTAGVAGQNAFLEIKPRSHMRIVACASDFDATFPGFVVLTRQDFSAGAVSIPAQILYSSDGTVPPIEVRNGNNAVVQLGASLSAQLLPSRVALRLEAGRVIRFQGLTLASGLKVTCWFEMPARMIDG